MKADTPNILLWLDMEMTGLDPGSDKVLEVAVVMTDWDFNELGTLDECVQYPPETIQPLLERNPFWAEHPGSRKSLLAALQNGKPLVSVENNIIELVESKVQSGLVLLAGNSIHQDRRFIRRYMPKLDAKLHYRMLDVTAWKVVMEGKLQVKPFEKHETHRAMDDTRESIAELRYYLEGYKKI